MPNKKIKTFFSFQKLKKNEGGLPSRLPVSVKSIKIDNNLFLDVLNIHIKFYQNRLSRFGDGNKKLKKQPLLKNRG